MATTSPSWWSLLDERASTQIASAPVGSPTWWVLRLEAKLRLEREALLKLERYYRGDHDLPVDIPARIRQAYTDMMRRSPTNFMRFVVDVTRERLKVQGLRVPGTPAEAAADHDTWGIWQENELDAWSQVAFTEALKKRRAYWSVWYPTSGGRATIAVEDPLQVIVEHDPSNRRRRAAALKMWVDDWTGQLRANLYLPDRVHKFEQSLGAWVEFETLDNPLGVVPIVPMVNRPSLLLDPDGESEIEDLMVIQDRLNENTLNRMLNGRTAAFKQKWATGLAIPVGDDGQPISTFDAAIDRFWVAEDPNVRFGSFDASPMDPYLSAHETDVQDIATLSRSPRHYFNQSGQAPSGDAMKSAESGLVAKVIDKQMFWGAAIEEVLRLARRVEGLDTPMTASIVWADPQFRTLGEQTDAVVKQVGAGLIPWQIGLEELGKSPVDIERIERIRERAVFDTAFTTALQSAQAQNAGF